MRLDNGLVASQVKHQNWSGRQWGRRWVPTNFSVTQRASYSRGKPDYEWRGFDVLSPSLGSLFVRLFPPFVYALSVDVHSLRQTSARSGLSVYVCLIANVHKFHGFSTEYGIYSARVYVGTHEGVAVRTRGTFLAGDSMTLKVTHCQIARSKLYSNETIKSTASKSK